MLKLVVIWEILCQSPEHFQFLSLQYPFKTLNIAIVLL